MTILFIPDVFSSLFVQDIVKKIENTQTDNRDRPLQRVEIAESGIIPVEKPFDVTKDGVFSESI